MNIQEIAQLPELLTPAQAAELLQVNRGTLAAMREANPALAIRLPGMKHFRFVKARLLTVSGIDVSPAARYSAPGIQSDRKAP